MCVKGEKERKIRKQPLKDKGKQRDGRKRTRSVM